MAIIIKEICVKTTIEKASRESTIGLDDLNRLKKAILRELREDIRSEKEKRRER